MKRLLSGLIAFCLALGLAADAGQAEGFQLTGTVVTEVGIIADAFGKADLKTLDGLKADKEIVLDSAAGAVTVDTKGVYHVTGSAENVTLTVNDAAKSGNITLILEDVSLSSDSGPAILVEAADKVILFVVGDCALSSTSPEDAYGAAVYSKDDLTITGTGTLSIVSAQDGIACKDDLRQTGAVLNVSAEDAGLNVNDSVRIGGGSLNIVSGRDGIHLSNSALDSWFYLEDGEVTIRAGQDGVDVSGEGDSFSGFVTLYGGSLQINAGGGSADASMKGIKCQGDIYVGQVTLSVTSTDDALHSGASISVTGGSLSLASGDDGIHADSVLSISGGDVLVSESYEGLEAYEIDLSGGNITVYAGDDGVNAAGGSDSASQEADPWARWRGGSSSTGVLNISSGRIYVNAQGDGLDSNGSIFMTGGYVIVEGPTNSGNGAIDKGDTMDAVASITGGTILAIGSAGMAVNFDTGTQCSALVSISGNAGDVVTVDDGSGFSFTAGKRFETAVYSSPSLVQGHTYNLTAGTSTAVLDFSSGLYDNSAGGFGGWGRPGGSGGGRPGGFGGGHGGGRGR